MGRRSLSYTPAALAVVLLLGAGGCAQILKGALAKAGVEDASSPQVGASGAPKPTTSVPRQRAPRVHTNRYEYMPTPSLWRMAMGQPYSVAYNASRWAMQNPCIPMPTGIADVLPVPEGAPVTPFASWGPVHLVAFGVPGVYLGGMIQPDGRDLVGQMMAHTARVSSQGTGCGFNVFFAVTLGSVGRVSLWK